MTASGQLTISANVREDVAASFGNSNSFANQINFSVGLDDNSTPDMDKPFAERIALTGGAATVDLTALVRAGRANLNLTGQIIYGFVLRNNGANQMTFVAAASNGYPLFPATTATPVGAGGVVGRYQSAGFGTVGASLKDITVVGTGTQTFDLLLFTGPAA